MITNRHEREFAVPADKVADLLDSLSSDDDRLWPRQWWPSMRFDRPLSVGAAGGHGPIRYTVEAYTPGQSVIFRFTAPEGFHGTHSYHIDRLDDSRTRLRHVLSMRVTGLARLSWPLVFRPLHDALIEDSLDVAEASLNQTQPAPRRWSLPVRFWRMVLR